MHETRTESIAKVSQTTAAVLPPRFGEAEGDRRHPSLRERSLGEDLVQCCAPGPPRRILFFVQMYFMSSGAATAEWTSVPLPY